jgi:hypothetical protein
MSSRCNLKPSPSALWSLKNESWSGESSLLELKHYKRCCTLYITALNLSGLLLHGRELLRRSLLPDPSLLKTDKKRRDAA